jgi:hypothetical protein
MTLIYYIDGEKYTTDTTSHRFDSNHISSPDENTPAFENLLTGIKFWCEKDEVFHRLTGPARIFPDGSEYFYINGKFYENVNDWLKDHPNPDLYFDTIGIFTETDKVLWFLQN